jgi:c-di-GMP-related signal transduction protein
LITTLTRARLCENLALLLGAVPDAAFIAGLITGVADLLGLTHAAMAEQIPLTSDIAAALVDDVGPLAEVLRVADAYESGNLAVIGAVGATDNLVGLYIDAMRWSTKAVRATT